MSINHFLVQDLDGSIIQVAFLVDNPKQIWLVMKSDVMAEWAKTSNMDTADDMWYKPDTIIDFAEYSGFSIKVFQEMAKSFNELEWDRETITEYSVFVDVLREANVVRYNEDGRPTFLDK